MQIERIEGKPQTLETDVALLYEFSAAMTYRQVQPQLYTDEWDMKQNKQTKGQNVNLTPYLCTKPWRCKLRVEVKSTHS
jgi:hypothetical protein